MNDERPTFNKLEYYVSIPENLPEGSPLPNLDMTVTDSDVVSTELTISILKSLLIIRNADILVIRGFNCFHRAS